MTLELAKDGKEPNSKHVKEILDDYTKHAAVKSKVQVLDESKVDELLGAVQAVELNREFLELAYNDVALLREAQGGGSSAASPRSRRRHGVPRATGNEPDSRNP